MRQRAVALRARTFSSLHVRNYRRYVSGQVLSNIGTWMQMTATALLVLRLTGSGTDLGVVIGLQTLPILLLGPFAGVVVDRLDKRVALAATQVIMGAISAVIAVLVFTGVIRIEMLFATSLIFGVANSIANPARQTFVLELVGTDELRNAVTLNSVLVNVARAVGPAVAAILIAVVGIGWCFVADAASYAAVIVSLATLDLTTMFPGRPVLRAKGQLREGFRYVASSRTLLVPLLMMAVIGTLTYEFQVALPLIAEFTFHGNSTTYGVMTASMGVGAVLGGLAAAGRRNRGKTLLARSALIFGAVDVVAALAPTLWIEILALAGVGAASVTFLSLGNTTLQLNAAPEMRGRVMALWAVAFLGTTPVGGPLVGAVGEHLGPRYGLLIGAAAALAAGAVGYLVLRRPEAPVAEPAPESGTPAQPRSLAAA